MSKLSRITQKIFGSAAGANQIGEFGSYAAGGAVTTTDPAVAQSLSNWLTGWFGAVVGGNSPAIEDMNAVCFVYAYQLAYLMQAGVAEWDSGTTYYIGSMVNSSSLIYVSLTNTNLNNAVTDTTKWKLLSAPPFNPQVSALLATRALNSWTAEAEAESNTWRGICWSPDLALFCAVSSDGTHRVQTSPDGTTWTTRTAAEANQWYSVCWSAELKLFCAVAKTGTHRVMTSPDGSTWTARTAAEANAWVSVCWAADIGLFCAVAEGGTHRVMTSVDGVNWNTQTASEANTWKTICWSPGLARFVAMSEDGTHRAMYSSDGATWTNSTIIPGGGGQVWQSVCWSPALNIFCAVSVAGLVQFSATSPDGITWTLGTAVGEANAWTSVAWAPELGAFVAVASGGTHQIVISFDGVNWNLYSSANANDWAAIAWSPKLGIASAVSNSGTNRVMISRFVQKMIAP